MPFPVTIVTENGLPVTEQASGTPMTPVESGGFPITIVPDGGIPVALVNDDLTPWEGGGGGDPAPSALTAPAMTGNLVLGGTMSATDASFDQAGTLTHQWQYSDNGGSSWQSISGETGSTYTVTRFAEVPGRYIRRRDTLTNGNGAASIGSNARRIWNPISDLPTLVTWLDLDDDSRVTEGGGGLITALQGKAGTPWNLLSAATFTSVRATLANGRKTVDLTPADFLEADFTNAPPSMSAYLCMMPEDSSSSGATNGYMSVDAPTYGTAGTADWQLQKSSATAGVFQLSLSQSQLSATAQLQYSPQPTNLINTWNSIGARLNRDTNLISLDLNGVPGANTIVYGATNIASGGNYKFKVGTNRAGTTGVGGKVSDVILIEAPDLLKTQTIAAFQLWRVGAQARIDAGNPWFSTPPYVDL